jgi:hypothetical protein
LTAAIGEAIRSRSLGSNRSAAKQYLRRTGRVSQVLKNPGKMWPAVAGGKRLLNNSHACRSRRLREIAPAQLHLLLAQAWVDDGSGARNAQKNGLAKTAPGRIRLPNQSGMLRSTTADAIALNPNRDPIGRNRNRRGPRAVGHPFRCCACFQSAAKSSPPYFPLGARR